MPNPFDRQTTNRVARIPDRCLSGAPAGSPAPCADQKAWKVAQVLIIDDQIHSVKMLSMAVRMLGHEALEALRGEDAVKLVNGSKPDIVFLDYMMPGMDGLTTLQHLRSLPEADDVPIYLLTATNDIYLEELARKAGAQGFLQKPVNLKELEGLLQT